MELGVGIGRQANDIDESEMTTLRAGDAISTGTPGGVGIFHHLVDLLEPGDVCEVEIEGIGALENPVVEQ